MSITICIPAYRAGRFIAATLQSVQAQTFTDYRVCIQVDPHESDHTCNEDDTWRAIQPFLDDERFFAEANSERLGWDANIRYLLTSVHSTYYVILPHDDLWVPDYLELLLDQLDSDPGALLAYADMCTIGGSPPFRKGVAVAHSSSRFEQVMDFLLQGAEAMPWRGLTRSSALDSCSFPVDHLGGFAVECEYALQLLVTGPAIHVPRPLYFKRIHPQGVLSASRERQLSKTRGDLEGAWKIHMHEMTSLVDKLSNRLNEVETHSLRVALHAAMLRRYQQAVHSVLPLSEVAAVKRSIESLLPHRSQLDSRIASRLHLLLYRHGKATSEPHADAEKRAHIAYLLDAQHAEACMALAAWNKTKGDLLSAYRYWAEAEALTPGNPLPREAISQISAALTLEHEISKDG